jgi:hypothetical protein
MEELFGLTFGILLLVKLCCFCFFCIGSALTLVTNIFAPVFGLFLLLLIGLLFIGTVIF